MGLRLFNASSKTQHYQWIGTTSAGQPAHGAIMAPNRFVAKLLLHQQGIDVKKIEHLSNHWLQRTRTIRSEDITLFSRQIATLLHAQIPFIQAMDIVEKSQKNLAMQALLSAVKHDVQAGFSFADALRRHPRFFHALFCNLVEAGEQSGALAPLLVQLASYQENLAKTRQKIKTALTYPFMILSVAILVAIGLLVIMIPQFETLFHSFGAQLPHFTQCVLNLSATCKAHWPKAIASLVVQSCICRYAYQHSARIEAWVDGILLKLPWFGQALEYLIVARLAHTLSITLQAGLPLVDALKTASNATGNIVYTKALLAIRDHITQGIAFHHAMAQSQLFPNMVVQMIAVGEESGKLESMLTHVAATYDELTQHITVRVNHILEPTLMIILGLIVGALIVAMYLPIFQLGAIV